MGAFSLHAGFGQILRQSTRRKPGLQSSHDGWRVLIRIASCPSGGSHQILIPAQSSSAKLAYVEGKHAHQVRPCLSGMLATMNWRSLGNYVASREIINSRALVCATLPRKPILDVNHVDLYGWYTMVEIKSPWLELYSYAAGGLLAANKAIYLLLSVVLPSTTYMCLLLVILSGYR